MCWEKIMVIVLARKKRPICIEIPFLDREHCLDWELIERIP